MTNTIEEIPVIKEPLELMRESVLNKLVKINDRKEFVVSFEVRGYARAKTIFHKKNFIIENFYFTCFDELKPYITKKYSINSDKGKKYLKMFESAEKN